MREYIRKRVLEISAYIVDTNATVSNIQVNDYVNQLSLPTPVGLVPDPRGLASVEA